MLSEINLNLENDQMLASYEHCELWQIGRSNLPSFTKFVFDVYGADFAKRYGWKSSEEDLNQMLEEDQAFFPRSVCFAFKHISGEIIGTSKITHKGDYYVFPIETKFQINLAVIEEREKMTGCSFWHGGRLAVDVEKLKHLEPSLHSRKILTEMYSAGFHFINEFSTKGVLITEFDARVYNLSRAMGANFKAINDGMHYLGSHTYPAYIVASDMNKWLQEKTNNQKSYVREKLPVC